MLKCVASNSQRTVNYNEVLSVLLKTVNGEFQILPDYAEAFIILQDALIVIKQLNKKEKILENIQGLCYIKDNVVTLVT